MDVLIIGSGLAGLSAAAMAAAKGEQVTLVTKQSFLLDSASFLAQGGIVYRGKGDSPTLLLNDIQKAAQGLTLEKTAKWISNQGIDIIEDFLINTVKVPFNKQQDQLALTGEAAHSKKRILYAKDHTGKIIIESIEKYLSHLSNVSIFTNYMTIELITIPHHSIDPMSVYEKTRCLGTYVMDIKNRQIKKIFADKIILATGGIGKIYEHSTNPSFASGDGVALGYRAGARIVNMEFTQFHPTTLAIEKANHFLLSEAIRGEGGVIVNQKNEDIIKKYDSRGSLAPRDVVSRYIVKELIKTGENCLYLSLKNCKEIDIKKRFPSIYQKCLQHKIDITKEKIPITPAFHFSCGGILTDMNAKTTVKNLFAIGETACTGLHGANRLASMSLLECVAFAKQAVECNAKKKVYKQFENSISDWKKPLKNKEVDIVWIRQKWKTIRSIMWNYVGIVRKHSYLVRALEELTYHSNLIDNFYREYRLTKNLVELRNGVQTAILVTNSAIKNPISRGCHYLQEESKK